MNALYAVLLLCLVGCAVDYDDDDENNRTGYCVAIIGCNRPTCEADDASTRQRTDTPAECTQDEQTKKNPQPP